jgi:uncharacterized integral membrane protein
MRKFKIVLALVIIGVIAMFVAQNEPYFKANNSFRVKVPMMEEYHSPLIYNWQICLGAFGVGVILVFLASLPGRMRTRKTLKELNATIQTHQDEITTLKKDTPQPSSPSPPSAEETPPPSATEAQGTESAQAS